MQINRNTQTSKKKLFIGIAIVLVVAGLTGAVVWGLNRQSSDETTNDTAQEEQFNADKKAETNKGGSGSTAVDPNLNTDEVPASQTTSIKLDSLNSVDGLVNYSATITGEKEGLCSATFTSELGKPVVKSANSTGSGTCTGSYNVAEFDALGKWNLTLRYYTNNTQTEATGEVNVE